MKWLLAIGLALVLVSVGCVTGTQPSQNQTLNDGTIVQPDGTMVKIDGTMVKPDGTMIAPDGTMTAPDGTMTKPDGTIVKPDGTMIKPDGTMVAPDGTMIAPNPTVLVSGNVEYVPFTLASYAQAKAQGKTIFLEFYASWCPICIRQAPALKGGLESIQSDTLVAFRVNFKDTETDADETALAQKFNITYQHTHIVADAQENELLRSQEEWNKQAVIEKVGAFA